MFSAFAKPQPSSAEKVAAAEVDIRALTDMANRMGRICAAKCLDKTYREADLSKGEAVCLDRCAAKFFDAQKAVTEQLAEYQQQQQQQQQAAAGGNGWGS